MKILVNNGTYELLEKLKEANYQVEVHEDNEELFKEVEKVVEVEKPLPEYLTTIKEAVEKVVDEKVDEKAKEYLTYKEKYEQIASIFKDEDNDKEEDE